MADVALVIGIVFITVLFVGDPDLHDKLMDHLECKEASQSINEK